MHVIENPVKNSYNLLPNIPIYMKNLKAAAFDIETTGLSAERNIVFLIGVLTEGVDGLKLTQFLASCPEEEPLILNAFFDYIADIDIFLNYNGNSFDIPFINKRSNIHGLNRTMNSACSVDYFRLLNSSYVPQILPNMKLKTVEKLAGIFREDKISGKECISLYYEFSERGNKAAANKILLHNFEDLSGFPTLNKLITKIDFHSAFRTCGFHVRSAKSLYKVENVKDLGDSVLVLGHAVNAELGCAYYGDDYTLIIDKKNMKFKFEIYKSFYSIDYESIRDVNDLIISKMSELNI